MMALPTAVQKQVDEADRLIADLNKPAEPAAEPAPNPPAPVSAVTPPVTPPAADPVVDKEGWQHQYNVLQGKYNAEVPRLTRKTQQQEQMLRDLTTRLDNTQTLLASLNPGQTAKMSAAPASPPQRLVKDEEVQAFGPDLIDVMRRISKEENAAKDQEIADLRQQLVGLGKTVETSSQVAARTAEERVIAMLDEQVPDWRVQNEDAGYLNWLEEHDIFGGNVRGVLLSQAFRAHDASRVVAFFKGYLNENALLAAPPTPAPETPTPEALALEGLVAPGDPKSGPNGGAPEGNAGKRIWNQSDAQQLYAQINEFTKKGKPAPKELQSLEVDLIKAQREGRLQA